MHAITHTTFGITSRIVNWYKILINMLSIKLYRDFLYYQLTDLQIYTLYQIFEHVSFGYLSGTCALIYMWFWLVYCWMVAVVKRLNARSCKDWHFGWSTSLHYNHNLGFYCPPVYELWNMTTHLQTVVVIYWAILYFNFHLHLWVSTLPLTCTFEVPLQFCAMFYHLNLNRFYCWVCQS